MSEIKFTIDSIKEDFDSIVNSLAIDDKNLLLKSLEARSTDPELWKDQENAKKLLSEIEQLRQLLATVERLKSTISTLSELSESSDDQMEDLADEINKTKRDVDNLKTETYLSGKFDRNNAILSIHAGQGGVEAMDWTQMLYRMYLRYCENKKWTVVVLDVSEGEEAGLKSVVIKVEGIFAYGFLKCEAGTHRLVRQSPFNADKLRQTSFALVEVLPEVPAMENSDIEIKDEDLEWQFFRASSQGGQNVQKVSTAVRLKHKPTGIIVTSQTQRYQEQNRRYALDHLMSKLWALKQEELAKEEKVLKGEYSPASWGNQIRSYVLHPYKLVKDLRTGHEESDTDSVLNGVIDNYIQAELERKFSKHSIK